MASEVGGGESVWRIEMKKRVFLMMMSALASVGCTLERAEENGEACDLNTNAHGWCRFDQYCARDAECEPTQTCRCEAAGGECQGAMHNHNGFGYCLPEYVCRNGDCIKGVSECEGDAECNAGREDKTLACVAGACVCGTQHEVCGIGQTCCLNRELDGCVVLGALNLAGCTDCKDGYADCDKESDNGCETNLNTDNAHCGTCGKACPGGMKCIDGVCAEDCPPGQIMCDGICVNPTTDRKYCGATIGCTSYQSCEDGRDCIDGVCDVRCTGNFTRCVDEQTLGGYCADLIQDVENCGGCGHSCAEALGVESVACMAGVCRATGCPLGQHLQGGECVMDSETACGSGATDCTALSGWKDGDCINGQCVASVCDTKYSYLDAGKCLPNDNSNCGSKGNVCASPMFCSEGQCGSSCSSSQQICDGVCIDIKSDLRHCGGCGKLCDVSNGTVKCSAGECILTGCDSGYHPYGSSCEADSEMNCGSHGNVCEKPNATMECYYGTCVLRECVDNYHVYNNGCEADSSSNCGTHGQTCSMANGSGSCVEGGCQYSCNPGYHLYNDVCEADSTANCGTHGNACSYSNGTAACSNGTCALSSCNSGYHVYNSTCEADSVSNCGTHGNACSYANGTALCSNGTCMLSKCDSGYHVYNNTCEIHSTSNCGSHGKTCGVSNGTGTCNTSSGTCTILCDIGYHVYNGACEVDSASNCGGHGNSCGTKKCCSGACVDTTSDKANCGACGTTCSGALTCIDSTCSKLVLVEECSSSSDCASGLKCCRVSGENKCIKSDRSQICMMDMELY